jgi:glyoxylase-like metal-dependent hydrolase (beta-lactamase superfamily II)
MAEQQTYASGEAVSEFKSWKVGGVVITRVVETVFDMAPEELFTEGDTAQVLALPWLRPHFVTPEGRLTLNMQALVVDAPGRRIMVDTCVGNDKPRAFPNFDRLQTSFLQDLERAGFARGSVDVVLCTHMHIDHVGWNTMLVDGEWRPTFPNARYLFNRAEYEFWRPGGEGQQADAGLDAGAVFADSIQPVMDAGLVDLVEGSHQVCPEVTLVPTPGHSPGHVSVRIGSQGREALITGDSTHHPCQLAHLHWSPGVDYDVGQSRRTRERLFAEAADSDVLVIGTHWAGPTAGRVVRDGAAYRLEV